jgi:hypothetical protein
MEWIKNPIFSWYTSDDGRYVIEKQDSCWNVYDKKQKDPIWDCGKIKGYRDRKYLGYFSTLREAKAFVEKISG